MRTVGTLFYALIAKWEGLRLKAYKDTKGIWTIGYGTIVYPDGTPVKEGDTCTEQEAEHYLNDHNAKNVAVLDKVLPTTITQQQFDTICSITYNIGLPSFLSSTLRKRIDLNSGSEGTRQAFMMWNKVRKSGILVFDNGLDNRRKDEADHYCADIV